MANQAKIQILTHKFGVALHLRPKSEMTPMVALATGMTGIALEHLTTLVGPVIFLGIPMNASVLLT